MSGQNGVPHFISSSIQTASLSDLLVMTLKIKGLHNYSKKVILIKK